MPEFQIIYGNKNTPKEHWLIYREGQIEVWDSPQQANGVVKKLNNNAKSCGYSHLAYMLQRMPDPVDYLARESAREGYVPFEVQGEEFHCAELKPDATISYYATKYDAYDDKRSNMKVGRYLHKYTDKGDIEIGQICARYGVEFKDGIIQFAKTREEIRHVYENGPNSCMSDTADAYNNSGIHPCEAYAAGDIEVAYLERNERITARCVCIPSKMKYTTIYGDRDRMQPLMEELGYSNENAYSMFEGCKMLKLDIGNGRLAAPFIDGDAYYHDLDEKHMTVSTSGDCYGTEEGWINADFSDYDNDYDYDYDDY